MPIYEYKCPACGAAFEKLCRSSSQDGGKQTCPECGYEEAGRVLSRVGSVRAAGQGNASACGTTSSRFS